MAEKIGLLAGQGDLPKRIIDQCVKEGRPFHIIAFKNQTEPELVEGHPHTWVRLGAAGKTISILKEEQATTLLMAGRIQRPSMLSVRPDTWGLKFLAKTGAGAFGDDGLLSRIITALEEEGFKVIGAHEILDDLLAPQGILGNVTPDVQAQKDVEKGMEIAHQIGALDIGQAVVVQDGLVIAVEAIEGTDNMLLRCKEHAREGLGGVLVKAKKPDQEKRADLPTIGIKTIHNAKAAGLRGIAVEANGSIIVDRENVIKEADKLGLFILGVKP
ncbi:UDP-2,3-diacylglucosamine diphosphatase LpxI [Terasakiella sp. A23]|uniref:LpxI family protein n=1 Tax=Terasakiella sp. FCG-A23 TaxID=3080561 RepID=UPI002953C598|nr:UDP-2,3-diacylglucosamine diphosphatase LpxI [Terasakiella sp. A23]MDV7338873.1 UDP-2,3-diacylglucosamine diphosphatase LpxI [Terasakiella sp. A23]